MEISRLLTLPRLKVISAFLTNISAAWFLTLLAIHDPISLTVNFFYCILALQVASDIEAKVSKYA